MRSILMSTGNIFIFSRVYPLSRHFFYFSGKSLPDDKSKSNRALNWQVNIMSVRNLNSKKVAKSERLSQINCRRKRKVKKNRTQTTSQLASRMALTAIQVEHQIVVTLNRFRATNKIQTHTYRIPKVLLLRFHFFLFIVCVCVHSSNVQFRWEYFYSFSVAVAKSI